MEFDGFEELAKLAFKKEELSDFAALPTKYTYLRLSILYDSYARGLYTKEQCAKMKMELKREYEKILEEHDRDMQCYREYLDNRRINTELIIKMNKATTKTEILDAAVQIAQNCLNDKSLYRNIMFKCRQLDF